MRGWSLAPLSYAVIFSCVNLYWIIDRFFRYCNSQPPSKSIEADNVILLVFESNSKVVDKGFALQYGAVSSEGAFLYN